MQSGRRAVAGISDGRVGVDVKIQGRYPAKRKSDVKNAGGNATENATENAGENATENA
jgi:hypothetical protein